MFCFLRSRALTSLLYACTCPRTPSLSFPISVSLSLPLRGFCFVHPRLSRAHPRSFSLSPFLSFSRSESLHCLLSRVVCVYVLQCALATDGDFVDTIQPDSGGRNCLWYAKNVKKTPYICSSNDAKTMCPMTCRAKVLNLNFMHV